MDTTENKSVNKRLFLDLNSMDVTQEGVKNFYWPIHPHEVNKIYVILIRRLVGIIRSAMKENVAGIDAAIILYFHFAHEAICAHQATILIQRAKRDGYEIIASATNRLISAFLEGQIPALPARVFDNLRNGPPSAKWRRLPFRLARDFWMSLREGIRRRLFFPSRYKQCIITTIVDRLAVAQSKVTHHKIFFRRFNTWFKKPQPQKTPRSDFKEIQQRLLDSMQNTLLESSDGFSPLVNQYMSLWLDEAFQWVGCYLEQLLAKPHRIPKYLWTHTSGDIWSRILARCVRKHGGKVTRFSHGSGAAYFQEPHEQACNEFEDCDVFVALSKKQALSFDTAFTGKDLVQQAPPSFIAITQQRTIFSRKKITAKKKNNRLKVMYIATVYTNEHVYTSSNGLMSGITLLDWEARLISKLKNWNFTVMLKPHPADELAITTPKNLEKLHGSVIVNGLLEDVLGKADIVLFDYPSSTVFVDLLLTDIPIVYLDFDISRFNSDARQLLHRRMPIVKGWYDAQNRAQLDWTELHNAILKSTEYKDSSFAEIYWASSHAPENFRVT